MKAPGSVVVAAMVGLSLASCSGAGVPSADDVVVTLVPADAAAGGSSGAVGWPYPEGARLVWLAANAEPRELSTGLLAAGAPDVAPDGRHLLFAGRSADDRVQAIYEIQTGDRRPRRIYAGDRDCGDPAYLAHGAILFACETPLGDGSSTVRALFVLGAEASAPERITWAPVDALDPTPLADGRILFGMPHPNSGAGREVALYTVNADGSLPEPFGDVHATGAAGRRPRQADSGDILVVSAPGSASTRGIARIPFARPTSLDPVEPAGELGESDILTVEPDGDALLVVAMREGAGRVFRVRVDGSAETVTDTAAGAVTPIEAVPLRPRTAPRGRPRIVADSGDTGFLVGYDAGRTDGIVGPPQGSPAPHAVRFQMQRAGRTRFLTTGNGASAIDQTADLPLHGDRSFFLEVPADVPLRVTTVEADGRTIATSAWFWVRPGETRACFGCHAGHAAAPVNRPIEAIQTPPMRFLEIAEAIAARTAPAPPTEAGQ